MKKQTIVATLLLAGLVTFAACSNADTSTDGTSSSTKDEQTMQDNEMMDDATKEEKALMEDKDNMENSKDDQMTKTDDSMMDDSKDNMTDGAKDNMADTSKDTMKDSSKANMATGEKTVAANPAPDFTFTDFDGNSVSLSDFKDENVYVKFWASWCTVCLSSLPEVDELAAMDNNFKVITVVAPGANGEKSMNEFKAWFEKKDYKNITVLFDENGTYMKEFGVRAFPSSAYIDGNGGIMKFEIGHNSNDKIIKVFA